MSDDREVYSGVPDDFADRDPEAIEGVIESVTSGKAVCHNCGGEECPWILLGCVFVCGDCLALIRKGLKQRCGDLPDPHDEETSISLADLPEFRRWQMRQSASQARRNFSSTWQNPETVKREYITKDRACGPCVVVFDDGSVLFGGEPSSTGEGNIDLMFNAFQRFPRTAYGSFELFEKCNPDWKHRFHLHMEVKDGPDPHGESDLQAEGGGE